MSIESLDSTITKNKFLGPFPKIFGKNILPYLVLLFTIVIIFARDTRYFFQPRFWAEEGTLHFAYSYNHSWLNALFKAQVGYLNFWPNLSTLIATLFPLEAAPLITTIMALLIQLVPIVIILFSNSFLWNSWIQKILGIAIFMFSPLTAEVWLNSVNSYNYFAVITFLILLENTSLSTANARINRILLVLGGLTGTISCFLIPLFLFRAIDEKDKERLLQTLILFSCAIIQIVLIFSYQTGGSFGQRFHMVGLSTFGMTMWTQGIALFAFGFSQADEWARMMFSLASQDIATFQMWGRLLLAAGVILLFFFSSNLSMKLRFLFFSSYLVTMLLPMMFSIIEDKYALIDTGLHQRLFLAPNIILGWMLLTGIRFYKGKGWQATVFNLVSLSCALMIGASLFWGSQTYRKPWSFTQYWPDWKEEVSTWKANPEYSLKIQPEGWTVQLQK